MTLKDTFSLVMAATGLTAGVAAAVAVLTGSIEETIETAKVAAVMTSLPLLAAPFVKSPSHD